MHSAPHPPARTPRRGLPVPAALLALLVTLAGAPSHAQTTADVRMLPSSAGMIRFVVDVPRPAFEPVAGTRGRMAMTLSGYQGVAPEGRPLLPQRVVAVAVPPTGEVSVSAGASGTETRPDLALALAPIRMQHQAKDAPAPGSEEALTEAVADLGGSPAGSPPPLETGVRARLLEVGWMRNQRIARIAITPADYDAATRTLTLAHAIDVRVTIGAGEGATAGAARPAEVHDPFERAYRQTVVNYEQGKAWRRTALPRATDLSARLMGAMRSAAAMRAAGVVPDTSVYAGRQWVKIAIDSSGFYSVRFSVLRNLALFNGSTTTSIDSLRLFTWPGFPVLPEGSYCDSCDYREVAMGFVESTPNRTFDDNNDYLYFYALGASDWASIYDRSRPDTVFINHPYEKTNYYYLTIATPTLPVGGSPKRIQTVSGDTTQATGGEVTPATFAARQHLEYDFQYWPNAWPNTFAHTTLFWEYWFWQNVEMGKPPFVTAVDAPGVDVNQPSQLRVRFWGVTDLIVKKSFGISDHYLDVSFNGHAFGRRQFDGLTAQTYDTTLVGLVQPSNQLSMSVPRITDPNPIYNNGRVDVTALAWYDLFYQRRFEALAEELAFDSPASGGRYIYQVNNFTLPASSPPRVFDVTDPYNPVEVLGGGYAGGTLKFYRAETGQHRYRVIADGPAPTVSYVRPLTDGGHVFMAPGSSLNNLRAAPGPGLAGADYLVIYYDGFQAAAESLSTWRATRLPLDGVNPPYATASVPISAVYDQFSGGRADPGAIRNFLRAAFYNWPHPPAFVTLFGDASYDFKNILGFAPAGLPGCLLPAYEGGYVAGLESQYATDDWMMNVDDAQTVIPDFFAGRIPAGDETTAMAFVKDKLLPYERNAPLGEWRNRVLLIADDNMQGPEIDGIGWLHLAQTAALDTAAMAAHIDRQYVYLHTYPTINDSKPAAKADIVKYVNDGVIMWNYVGHGSPFKIADENAFLTSDVGALHNATMPGLFVAASCDVGKFHDPSVQSLGELLVMNSAGGCIGVVSATEIAFSTENAELNKTLYKHLFSRDTTASGTGLYHVTVAEALLAAKTGSENGQKYQLMGDAATLLLLPRLSVEVSLSDSVGAPLDTLRRGQLVTFSGRILDRPRGSPVPFTGSVGLLIEDSAPIDSTPPPCVTCTPYTYPFRAAPMFRGDARVLNGTFSGRFVVPLDAVLGPRGRARGYVSGDETGVATAVDGAGSDRFVLQAGGTPGDDSEGPRIGLSFAGGSTSVKPDAQLRIDLSDPHGILITGHTIQNGIIVTIDGNSNTRVDVTPSFRYSANSYQAGTATFKLPNLATGHHTIAVSAADNLATGINAAQHRSSAGIEFDVSAQPALAVQRAFLFPNPTRSGAPGGGGTFVIDAPGDPVNVLLSLYTINGRLIRTLKAFGGQNQIQLPWDGLDAEGDRLANGTYLFRVQVNGRDADGSSSARSAATAEGKLVIVGH